MRGAQFLEIARVVSDPTRLEILSRIAQAGELPCAHLTAEFDITPATVSHHIKELTAAGLITGRKEGRYFFYRLEAKVWAAYLAELTHRIPTAK
jgi:ArsR family transcriptional regulator, arsenate/arsenite/antimonite-responsive transcriptional repressor